ncbi:MAG: FAD:protein FMN transferase [bacterium]
MTAAVLFLTSLSLAGCGKEKTPSSSGEGSSEAGEMGDSGETSPARQEDIIGEVTVSEKDGLTYAEVDVYAMTTPMQLKAYGDRAPEAVQAAAEEIVRLDRLLSVGNPESEIGVINAEGKGQVSADTLAMLKKAVRVHERSEGALDISVYPMMELWGFTTEKYRVPSQEEIERLLPLVDQDLMEIEEKEEGALVRLSEGQGIDLGAVAKGFTSERVAEIFKSYGLESGLIYLGGNVQCLGSKPGGADWRIGIQDPGNSMGMIGVLAVSGKAVITSGAYERFFKDEETGKTYHHILDPSSGYPAETGVSSVTIVSPDGTLADSLSTACFVMGLDKSVEYWRQYGDDFEMIIMDEEGLIHLTEGLEQTFAAQGHKVKIIYR